MLRLQLSSISGADGVHCWQVAPAHVDSLWVTNAVSALYRICADHGNAPKGGGPLIRQDPNAPRLTERCTF